MTPTHPASSTTGQVTTYLILGLSIILLAGILLYARRVEVSTEMESTVRKILVPPEAQPMQEYLTDCLHKTASQGITLMASQGGWLQANQQINRIQPTEGEAVALSPSSDQHIPYWHYLSSRNDCTGTCTFASHQPPLKKPAPTSMEAQLDRYVLTTFKTCLKDFEPFTSEGYIVSEQGPLSVYSTILDTTVTVYATYPLRFERPGLTIQTKDIFTAIPARLGLMYQLADDLTRLEREHRFLERHARQLIDLSSGLSPEELPPLYEVEFRFGTGTTWTKTGIKNHLKNLLATYTPFLQVFSTANYRPIISPPAPATERDQELFDRIYNRNMLVIANPTNGYPDLEARFSYLPWWEPYMDLNCQGELCRPEVLLNTLGITYGIQRYLFSYDLSFPTLIEIKDPEAFQGRGLTFSFMLEGNIRNNEAMPAEFQPLQMDYGSGASMFCDPAQFTGKNLSLALYDGRTGRDGRPAGAATDADVLYTCGAGTEQTSCLVGKTDPGGRFTGPLPVCLGGIATIVKDGYGSVSFPLDSDEAGTASVHQTLEPLRAIDIEVKRLRLIKTPQGWALGDDPVGLDKNQGATVSLRKTTMPYEEEFFAIAQQFGDVVADASLGQHTAVRILPGNYSIDVMTTLTPDPPLIIPVSRRCTGKECQDIPPQPIAFNEKNPLPSGGASFTYEIKKENLDSKTTLTLYAIDIALDLIPEDERAVEDLDLLGDIQELTTSYRQQVEPVWS